MADSPRAHDPRRTTLGACASKEVDRVEHTDRLHHPDGRTWPPRTFSLRSALNLSFAAFLAEKVWQSHHAASTEKNRDDSLDCGMESGGLHATIEGITTMLLR